MLLPSGIAAVRAGYISWQYTNLSKSGDESIPFIIDSFFKASDSKLEASASAYKAFTNTSRITGRWPFNMDNRKPLYIYLFIKRCDIASQFPRFLVQTSKVVCAIHMV